MVIDYDALLKQCSNGVHPQIMHGIIRQESSFNPYAIGIVKGRLSRQPVTKEEAILTVKLLQSQGKNFSMGLAQINKQHMIRFGFTAENIFEPCANVKAGAQIFNQCHVAAKQRFGNTSHAIGAALSCYYSGNFSTGFKRWGSDKAPYVDSVRAQMLTYDKRPAQIGTPQLQRLAMNIKVQTKPKFHTISLTSNEVSRNTTFLIGGQTQKVSDTQHIRTNSSLLF